MTPRLDTAIKWGVCTALRLGHWSLPHLAEPDDELGCIMKVSLLVFMEVDTVAERGS